VACGGALSDGEVEVAIVAATTVVDEGMVVLVVA